MLATYVLRGAKAGAVAGLAFGLFVAVVGGPLIRYAETFETGSHGGGPVVSGAVTTVASVAGGVLTGVLLGTVVLGAVFYFLEPAIPGGGGTKSYLLAAAGFVIVTGAPWLVLPPQPPGVEQSLPVGTRLALYLGMMVAGAMACGMAGYVFDRLRTRHGRWLSIVGTLVPFGLPIVAATLAPENAVTGPVPSGFTVVFQTVVGTGQVGLWLVLASVHAWLLGRERDAEAGPRGRTTRSVEPGSPTPD